MKYFFGVLPIVLFLLLFIYLNRKDNNKYKVFDYIVLFILGCITCYISNKIENKVGGYFPRMINMTWYQVCIYAVLGVSIFEEGLKWFFTLIVKYKDKVNKINMITYSVICSLGFAFLENIVYYIAYSDVNGALSRMFSSVPSHVCFAIIMGLLLYYGLNNKGLKRYIYLLLSVIVPIIIHALYNVFLYKGIASLSIYAFIILAVLEVSCVVIVIKSLKE